MVPPMIARLFRAFFAPPPLTAVAVALLVPVEENSVEALEDSKVVGAVVVGAVVVAKCATDGVNEWPTWPKNDVSAVRGASVDR